MIVAYQARATYASAHHHANPRVARLVEEHAKLARSLDNYLAAHPSLVALGPDPLVQQLVAAKGFTDQDVVISRALLGPRRVTVLCIPTRIWHDEFAKAALLHVKEEAALMGYRIILVPQRWIKAPIRASVSRSIAMCRRVTYTGPQFTALLEHVRASKITTLIEAARHLPDHDDPLAVVLLLCGQGILAIDRSRPIASDTWIATLA